MFGPSENSLRFLISLTGNSYLCKISHHRYNFDGISIEKSQWCLCNRRLLSSYGWLMCIHLCLPNAKGKFQEWKETIKKMPRFSFIDHIKRLVSMQSMGMASSAPRNVPEWKFYFQRRKPALCLSFWFKYIPFHKQIG